MKLIINYELLNQIRTANTGINVKRIKLKMALYFGILTILDLPLRLSGEGINSAIIIPNTIFALSLYSGSELATSRLNKAMANEQINTLSSKLQNINIYTTPDKLKQATLYKTSYKLKIVDKVPTIRQNKYIMVPTDGYLNNDEVSVLQEHDMFTREYVLSRGEPEKKRKKILSKVFAH